MIYADFKTFMAYATGAFPDMKVWLGKQSESSRKGIWSTWSKALKEVALDAAQAAIDRMVSDTKLQPFGGRWDQLPGTVIGLCAGTGVRPKGNSRCICWGEGLVTIVVNWPAKTGDGNSLSSVMIDGETWYGPICAACLCPVGRWVNECRRKRFDPTTGPILLPDYDPKRMRIWHGQDLIFAPGIEERDRRMMSQAVIDFDGVQMDAGMLDL